MSVNSSLVSVLMITYNQAEYIQQALTSVLDQICRFEFEVILSNDASSDNSDKLISEVIKNHSNGFRVKYFNQPVNLGMNPNLAFVYAKCNGKYIAVCEGDDYWTDRFKLQKQVDFLEANPDFSLCYHPVNVLFPDRSLKEDFGVKEIIQTSESTVYDLAVLGNYIHTPSVVFRKILESLPYNFNQSPLGDFFLWICISEFGKIKKLDFNMAVYRFGTGEFSIRSGSEKTLRFIKTLELLSDCVENKTLSLIIKNRSQSLKFSFLPPKLRTLDDCSACTRPDIVSEYISIQSIIIALLIKFNRLAKVFIKFLFSSK